MEDNLNEIISDNSKPDSFVTAVHIFLIGVAVGYMKKEDTESNNNRSMIIHPHHLVAKHGDFYNYTVGIIKTVKSV